MPNSVPYAAASRSAVGERQMFPVQTKRTCRAGLLAGFGREVIQPPTLPISAADSAPGTGYSRRFGCVQPQAV